ncbi:MAG: hypothetical protein ACFFDW_00800 [Candidatus Thorarchaeota archaeon]
MGQCVASYLDSKSIGIADSYSISDWDGIWNCLSNYFWDGDEQEVEILLSDYEIPILVV